MATADAESVPSGRRTDNGESCGSTPVSVGAARHVDEGRTRRLSYQPMRRKFWLVRWVRRLEAERAVGSPRPVRPSSVGGFREYRQLRIR